MELIEMECQKTISAWLPYVPAVEMIYFSHTGGQRAYRRMAAVLMLKGELQPDDSDCAIR